MRKPMQVVAIGLTKRLDKLDKYPRQIRNKPPYAGNNGGKCRRWKTIYAGNIAGKCRRWETIMLETIGKNAEEGKLYMLETMRENAEDGKLYMLETMRENAEEGKLSSPSIGSPPSSVGSFHFSITELRSYLSISTSFGSPGGSALIPKTQTFGSKFKLLL